MTKQIINVENYWSVIVYYNVDYDLFDLVQNDMESIGASSKTCDDVRRNMLLGKAKAFTYSSIKEHTSIVAFNRHRKTKDYINSLVHEAEHVKQAMLHAYEVEDKGEPPAYTVGFLMMRMWEVFQYLK